MGPNLPTIKPSQAAWMRRCTSLIPTAHGNALFCKKLHSNQQNGQRPLTRARPRLGQYFPKKARAVYTKAYLADCRQKLNTRPRKCLGFASPASRFFYELKGLHFRVEFAFIFIFRLIIFFLMLIIKRHAKVWNIDKVGLWWGFWENYNKFFSR